MNTIKCFWFSLSALLFASCGPQLPPYEVPYVPFQDIVVNLNLPEYQDLQFNGGYVYLDGGVRGLILYRESAAEYHCFERNCTWEANSACATVDVDFSGLYMIDPCCGSTFSFPSGQVSGGVAVYPLRKYQLFLNGSELTITDEILN